MLIRTGSGSMVHGPGIEIHLTGNEVAHAIDEYLENRNIIIKGSRTIKYYGTLLSDFQIYVDPSAKVTLGQVLDASKPLRNEIYKDLTECDQD